MRTPPRAWGFGRRLSGVPPRGDLGVGECMRYARGRSQWYALHRHAASKGCLLTFRQPLAINVRASGDASTLQRGGFRTPVTLANARRCRPTQKAHFCDRHHIARAMAELVLCLSIIPHMRSFDVPPKLSPAQAGLFCAARLKGGHPIGIVFGLSLLEALDDAGKLLVVKGQINAPTPRRARGKPRRVTSTRSRRPNYPKASQRPTPESARPVPRAAKASLKSRRRTLG
jgi:hypothetical protein